MGRMGRKLARAPPASLQDGDSARDPITEFIYDPTGFTGVSIGDDVGDRILEEREKVVMERAKVLKRRARDRGEDLLKPKPTQNDMEFVNALIPLFNKDTAADQTFLRRRTLGRIYADLDRASVLFSVSDWPKPAETRISAGEQLDGHLRNKHLAESQARQTVLSAAWIGRIITLDPKRPVYQEVAWPVVGDVMLHRLANVRGRYGVAMQTEQSEDLTQAKSFVRNERREIFRYHDFARRVGWMMLSMLAYSGTFRNAAATFDTDLWTGLTLDLQYLSDTTEFFVKGRKLDWGFQLGWGPSTCPKLSLADIQSKMPLEFSHPHEWYLPLQGLPQRLMYDWVPHENTNACVYEPAVCGKGRRPTGWPPGVPWPSDPRTIPDPTLDCPICRRSGCQTCGPDQYHYPLVEIIEYEGRGCGVRALQEIPDRAVLAEYTGEIRRPDDYSDGLFAVTMRARGRDVATISARRYGNWTRYINHSCDPNADFVPGILGGLNRVVVKSRWPIEAFDEITVDYGPAYWSPEFLCGCGARVCKYNTLKKVKAARQREGLPSI